MSPSLSGRVAVVTGASSGIGRATVESFAARGATVYALARRREELDELVAGVRATHGTARALTCDVTDREQVHAAIEHVAADAGHLDAVVNNAGVMLLGEVAGSSAEDWDRMIDVNLRGTVHVVDAALEHLRTAAAEGPPAVADIVNVSSVAGRLYRAGGAVYSATKAGIASYSESLRQEVAEAHIRVSVLEPGVVDTELFSHNRPGVLEKIGSRFGSITRLTPEDLADTITYVVSRPWHVALNEVLIRPTEQADRAG